MNNLFSMENKTVVFTGGCGNLGRPMVKALLEYGANVVVPDMADRFEDSFAKWKEEGKLVFLPANLSEKESIKEVFQKTEELFGGIDVLVNCVAYGGGAGGKSCEYRLDKIPDETWEEGIDGTLHVIFRSTREVIPYFDKQGKGNIVNIGSMYGIMAPDFDVYGDDIPWNPPLIRSRKSRGASVYQILCVGTCSPWYPSE